MDEVTRPTVSVQTAQHVLWWFGDTNLGVQPGTFTERLLTTLSAADTENLELLRAAFPELASAWVAVSREPWGLEWLRSKVKRDLVPDREHAPVDLFEAAAESPSYDQVEADYWAARPEAVPSDIKKGERVRRKGHAHQGTVVDVRDAGRTVQISWDHVPDRLTQNIASSDLVRIAPDKLVQAVQS